MGAAWSVLTCERARNKASDVTSKDATSTTRVALQLSASGGQRDWWRGAVVYQVYPRSFCDTNNDGIGDLPGVTSKLDYLVELGVDCVWLSPCFTSPMEDFGYDVSNHKDIDPVFGTLADLDALVREAHARGIRIVLDYVPNHTSSEHPWFAESRSSRSNPKADFYVWREGRENNTQPPNNWRSFFGGPAWTFDSTRQQWYLHLFLPEQPDLNWANEEVRTEMLDVLRFWLDRGIDGFRCDAVWLLGKMAGLPDEPANLEYVRGTNERDMHVHTASANQPETHTYVAAMRALADRYDALLIGEIYLEYPDLLRYYGTAAAPEFHLPFHFNMQELAEWSAPSVRSTIAAYTGALDALGERERGLEPFPNYVLGNHDRPRIATRRGTEHARNAAVLLFTLRGTITWYYGDELGMEDVRVPPSMRKDPAYKRQPLEFQEQACRDPCRTPMQWDASPNAGFTAEGVDPWLPLSETFVTTNVAVERTRRDSMLTFVRALLALRHAIPETLVHGRLELLSCASPDAVLVFRRASSTREVIVLINFSDEHVSVNVTAALGVESAGGDVLFDSTSEHLLGGDAFALVNAHVMAQTELARTVSSVPASSSNAAAASSSDKPAHAGYLQYVTRLLALLASNGDAPGAVDHEVPCARGSLSSVDLAPHSSMIVLRTS